MNVIKDLSTVISMIVSTITIAGIYYSDNGEVEKRKKIFLKNIAIIIVFTILLWMFSIYLFRIYFQTDLLTVLSLVNPTLVFEIGFEGIASSNRHKSGVAVRFPRILRWRTDKTIEDINSLCDLQQLLSNSYESQSGGD